MYKRLLSFLIIIMISLTSMTALAADKPITTSVTQSITSNVTQPVIFKSTFTVTKDGGEFQVGFVTFEFKKNFIDSDLLPRTFEVEVCAKNGEAGILVKPDTPDFNKKVHIKVDAYKGLLYDTEKGKNVEVNIKKQQIHAEHFSWLRFR